MSIGAVAEPLVVVSILLLGVIVNRDPSSHLVPGSASKRTDGPPSPTHRDERKSFELSSRTSSSSSNEDDLAGLGTWSSPSSSLFGSTTEQEPRWRQRTLKLFKWRKTITTPNTAVFRSRLLSRLLRRYPFLVEAWYWALIYWVYQIGRAVTALTLTDSTVDVARAHALQVIHLEQKLGIFIEPHVQAWFMARPFLMHWTNRIYSFIHIPGTIMFLVVLYYITTTLPRKAALQNHDGDSWRYRKLGPALYEARRRTMACCNLLAFIVFTTWPCMPPRLLSDPEYKGPDAAEAKGFGFVDTVHGTDGESSVWTTNRFCNQYAAMPSLHFGYAFLIGLTILTLPIQELESGQRSWWKRAVITSFGLLYPATILAAIVATANHFVLDAVAGVGICAMAWYSNEILLNLRGLEDWFLSLVRIHKPGQYPTLEEASRLRLGLREQSAV